MESLNSSTGVPRRRRPAVFLDRDGVLIEDTGYAHEPSRVRWIPGAISAVKRLNEAEFHVFVVTNQSGVGRGYYPESAVEALHAWMAERLAMQGARIDAWSYCPHHPEATLAEYRRDCRRRKPNPGMLEDLIVKWSVDRSASFLVGDRETDLLAAAAAGVVAYRFVDGSLDTFLDLAGCLGRDVLTHPTGH